MAKGKGSGGHQSGSVESQLIHLFVSVDGYFNDPSISSYGGGGAGQNQTDIIKDQLLKPTVNLMITSAGGQNANEVNALKDTNYTSTIFKMSGMNPGMGGMGGGNSGFDIGHKATQLEMEDFLKAFNPMSDDSSNDHGGNTKGQSLSNQAIYNQTQWFYLDPGFMLDTLSQQALDQIEDTGGSNDNSKKRRF